ncbi:hypothetical protein BJ138DRAFT_1112241 [Hygrophoropsis aurantiaca]|uniref:Uncharacterized protein n=1 Tax=Hygrophoropsis aurantiaca TaxID=72124 RepID=A0ACB8AH57_9AGAM|nr:hypothetical protein BJ138DRAFT_1112241 [Hygrophoropsis aurantiaca]
MADAWPDIMTFHLSKDGRWLAGAHATPSGLIALFEPCTKLQHLSLPVDFSTIDSADFDPSTVHHNKDAGAQLSMWFNAEDREDMTLAILIAQYNWSKTKNLYRTFCDPLGGDSYYALLDICQANLERFSIGRYHLTLPIEVN